MNKPGNMLPPYINGEFVSLAKPERVFQAANPIKPGEILSIAGWHKDSVEQIVDGMKSAQKSFAKLDFKARLFQVERLVAYLRENSDEIKSHLMIELGRSRFAVEEEWRLCEMLFAILPDFCRESLSEKTVHAEGEKSSGKMWAYAPVGLVLISANVSLPFYSLLSAMLPALVAGNSVCLRPSQHCALSGSIIAQGIHHVEWIPGLVQVVYGDLEVYRRLILTHQFDTVLYSGGEESLEQIRRDLSTHQNTRLVLCSGGKNAALILPTANIDDAVAQSVYGACVDCGQRMESTGLIFVDSKISNEFIDKLVQSIKQLPIGVKNDLNDASQHVMGPLCGVTSWERFLRFQGIAARESDETLRWGKPIDNEGNGFFVSPGVHLIGAQKIKKSVYASNAFFGPDLAVVPVSSADEAIAVLDELGAARALSVHTSYEEEVRYVRQASNVPTVLWNSPTTLLDPHLPTIGRGRAGNSYITGVRFLFSTVYPKTLNLRSLALVFFISIVSIFNASNSFADYRKAVEGNEVVKGKLYPKSNRIEINAVQAGGILNQSYLRTYLGAFGVTYHFNEWHAVNADFLFGITSDSGERTCVENFYFKPEAAERDGGPSPCDQDDVTDPAGGSPVSETDKENSFKRKPAYVPIRQLDSLVGLNYQWTPVYGKQLYFLSYVGYLDLFVNVGLGLARTTYWPLKERLDNGDSIYEKGTKTRGEYGAVGRPLPVKSSSFAFDFGLGNRFFFGNNFLINMELRDYTIFGDDAKGGSDWMNFVAVWGGLGMIF